MTKHISRKQRWTRHSPKEYSSSRGKVVYERNGWYAAVIYRTLALTEAGHAQWERHEFRLGPFKRSRNAMVALEEEVSVLQNRHGEAILLGDTP
jgi:hypothetical protein